MKKASVTPAFLASASTAVLSLPPENETFAHGRSPRWARIVLTACRSRFLRWCRFRSTTTSQPGSGYEIGVTGTSSRTLSRPSARTPVPYRPRYRTITGPSGSSVETSTRLPPSRTLVPVKAGSRSRSTTPRVAALTRAARAAGSGSNRWRRSTGSKDSQPNRSPLAITSSFRSVPPVLFSRRTRGTGTGPKRSRTSDATRSWSAASAGRTSYGSRSAIGLPSWPAAQPRPSRGRFSSTHQ